MMACKTESKIIGDSEYSVTQWPADKAMTVKFQLAKIFGASLATLISEDEKTMDLSLAFSKLFDNSSPEEIVSTIKSCVVGVSCDGSRITDSKFTELFSGDDLANVYKVFIFVLQVNFSNLLKGQGADRLLAKVKEVQLT